MKTCKNCKFYTGIQCHGHGDWWGECKKNKNLLFCYDDSPCLQDIKTLREIYYKQTEELNQLRYKVQEYQNYKTRYEIKSRTCQYYKEQYYKAIGLIK